MKKTVSVLLAVITLVMSVFTCNAFATEVENEIEFQETMTGSLLKELDETEEGSAKISFIKKIMGIIPITLEVEWFVNEKGQSATLKAGPIEGKAVLKNKIIKYWTSVCPFGYGKEEVFTWEEKSLAYLFLNGLQITGSESFLYVDRISKIYEETSNGKNYIVEEFGAGDSYLYRFYYLNEELVSIEKINIYDNSVNIKYDVEISYSVHESDFELPSTAIMDITWLYFFI